MALPRYLAVAGVCATAARCDRSPTGPTGGAPVPWAWRTLLPYGAAFWIGTPAVADGRVYVQSLRDVVGLDAANGTVLWQRPVRIAPYPPPTTLLAEGGQVYVSETDSLMAIDGATGRTVWAFHPDSQAVVVPALDATTFYSGQRGIPVVYALARTGGALRWRATVALHPGDGADVRGVAVDGNTVYVALTSYPVGRYYPLHAALVALDARDGRERWRHEFADTSARVPDGIHIAFGAPVPAGRLVLFNDGGGDGVVAVDTATHAIAWRTTADARPSTTILTLGTLVYANGSENAYAFDLATGATRWSVGRLGAALGLGLCGTALFVNDERVYRFDAATGRTTGQVDADGDATYTSGIVSDGRRVYVVGSNGVYAVGCG